MSRGKKPSKNYQIEVMHEKLDEFGNAVYHLSQYMMHYGLTKHYQKWVEASAKEEKLPPRLIQKEE